MKANRRVARRSGLALVEVVATIAVVVLIGVAALHLVSVFVAASHLRIDAVVGSTLMWIPPST